MIQMRFDNYYTDYSELYKVNKLLLLLIAKYYDLDGMIQEQDLINEQSYYISVSGDTISGEYVEAKFADLAFLSPDAGIECRLTLSTFSNTERDMLTEADYWLDVLRDATKRERFTELTNEINDKLVVKYSRERQSNEIKNGIDFAVKHMDCIFTKRQLIDLLARIGFDEPEKIADYCRMKAKSRFFSARQLRQYVTDLTISANDFLDIYRDTKTVTGSPEMKFYVSIKDNQQG